jgi:hypothetical protein
MIGFGLQVVICNSFFTGPFCVLSIKDLFDHDIAQLSLSRAGDDNPGHVWNAQYITYSTSLLTMGTWL